MSNTCNERACESAILIDVLKTLQIVNEIPLWFKSSNFAITAERHSARGIDKIWINEFKNIKQLDWNFVTEILIHNLRDGSKFVSSLNRCDVTKRNSWWIAGIIWLARVCVIHCTLSRECTQHLNEMIQNGQPYKYAQLNAS